MLQNNEKQTQTLKILRNSIIVIIIGLVLWALDFNILFWIQDFIRNDVLDVIIPIYTSLGEDGIIWIVLGLVLLIPKKYRKTGIMVLAALLVMLVVNNLILKNLIARPRPCWTYPEMVQLVHNPSSYSFPSGHTCASFAAVSAWWKFLHRGWTKGVCAGMAACMGLSRLYVGVHYPSDVLAGALVGIFCGCLACSMWRRFRPKRETDSAAR